MERYLFWVCFVWMQRYLRRSEDRERLCRRGRTGLILPPLPIYKGLVLSLWGQKLRHNVYETRNKTKSMKYCFPPKNKLRTGFGQSHSSPLLSSPQVSELFGVQGVHWVQGIMSYRKPSCTGLDKSPWLRGSRGKNTNKFIPEPI